MLLVNEKNEKMIFTVKEDSDLPPSIIVEVPTFRWPVVFGAGDVRDPNTRIARVVMDDDGVIIYKENGEKIEAPVKLTGKYEAKVYQFGYDKDYWRWRKDEDGKTEILNFSLA